MYMSKIEAVAGELSTEDVPTAGRREDRMPVQIGAGLRQRGAGGVTVDILDLSTKGFRAMTHLDLQIGADVWLRFDGLESLHARVAWMRGNCAGCQFVNPIHPAVLEMISKRTR